MVKRPGAFLLSLYKKKNNNMLHFNALEAAYNRANSI